jgi:hypothetical protein
MQMALLITALLLIGIAKMIEKIQWHASHRGQTCNWCLEPIVWDARLVNHRGIPYGTDRGCWVHKSTREIWGDRYKSGGSLHHAAYPVFHLEGE